MWVVRAVRGLNGGSWFRLRFEGCRDGKGGSNGYEDPERSQVIVADVDILLEM
jgi:hypothetical protein